MHPSRAIRGGTSELLAGRRIILGIAGSIAAIEVPRIARELIRHGADVRAVMSPEAQRIVTAEAVQFATGHPPVTQLTGDVEHVSLLGPGDGRADLLLIAPATANTIAKIAHGIDDTPVTSFASIALGGGVPVLIAPAMHAHMLQNPAVAEAVEKLAGWGVGIVRPVSAEGEEKLASPEEVAAAVLHRLARGPWVGRRLVVIGGAARERIDAVRSITNESSGAMAVALASQGHFRGAEVELWLGHHSVPVPSYLSVRSWTSVSDLVHLADSERGALARTAAIIVPAALADFTLTARPGKIPSRATPELVLRLRRATKVLPHLRALAPPPCVIVGFKLEAPGPGAELEASARRMQAEVAVDWVVADDSRTMGSSEVRALVLPSRGAKAWLEGPKAGVAGQLLDAIGRTLAATPPKDAGIRRSPARHGSERGTRAARRRR